MGLLIALASVVHPGDREELKMNIEIELEDDGRWIAEVPDLPGVMCIRWDS